MGIKVLSKRIGLNYSPFIIAEISANHNQSISTALKIIKDSAEAGVDAIRDIKKNEKFTKNNIKCLRGMLGLGLKYYYRILNKNSKKFIRFGQPIKFNLIK